MKKAIVPAPFLFDVTSNNTSILQDEGYMYIIREESAINPSSNLYRLFFGSADGAVEKNSATETVLSDPDYYSSYE